MKKHYLFLALFVTLFGLAKTPCQAYSNEPFIQNISDYYISGTGGFAWHNDIKFQNSEASRNFDYKEGWSSSLAAGLVVYERWRFELEASYRRFSTKRTTLISATNVFPPRDTDVKGHVRDFALMINGFYDLPLFYNFGIYAGAGVGIDFNERETLNPSTNVFTGNSDTLFAVQLLPGFYYKLNDRLTLTAGYRLFATAKPKRIENSIDFPLMHSIDLGLRLNF